MSSRRPASAGTGVAAGGLAWYVKRLRVMEPRELLHRVREQCALAVMQMHSSVATRARRTGWYDVARFSFCSGIAPQLPDLPWHFDPDDEVVAALLVGRGGALGCPWSWTRDAAVWHAAPDTGRRWPQSFFGSIPYRTGNPYGDVRIAWEPSRLQHLVLLGLIAGRLGGARADEAATLLDEQLRSWVEANPAYRGIHYLSPMECALRIIALCHATDLARASLVRLGRAEAVWQALLGLVREHANVIARRLSLHSSRGNHTVAEGAGLVYTGLLFPELDGAARWYDRGLAIVRVEADRQIAPDGGGAEQAWGYLPLLVDLFGLVAALLDHRRRPVPAAVRDAHRRGRSFLQAFAGGPMDLPAIGDGDNGHALSPALRLSFGSEDRSEEMRRHPDALTVRTFDESGYTLMQDTAQQVDVIIDHGPLGMAPAFGHGHADALAVVMRRDGEELLIDPGTYTYTGDPRWRAYFRGTRAHNTVTVDGLDQAVQEASFIWSHPYTASVVRREATPGGGFRLLARHDGYARLKPAIIHWRAVSYRPPGRWFIWDYLDGEGRHALDLHWHCGRQPLMAAGSTLFPGRPHAVTMTVEGGELTLHRGETDPILGWRSHRYGVKEPITTVRAWFCGALPHEFTTQLWVGARRHDLWEGERLYLRAWVEEAVHDAVQN